jgi:hypothetical protein
MTSASTREALELLKSTLTELESTKGGVAVAVQRLLRAAITVGDDAVRIWCEIHLGNATYTQPLAKLVELAIDYSQNPNEETRKRIVEAKAELQSLGIDPKAHLTEEKLQLRASASSGAAMGIGFAEERYSDFVRNKRGNDGTYYKNDLAEFISHVRKGAHARATLLYNRLAFSDSPQTVMDVLKGSVDDRLLEVDPTLTEQLMVAFRRAATSNPEEWSQALTTCRRFIEALADRVYPPTDQVRGTRQLGPTHYINRLWAFMDDAIVSETNRELAKAHVDFLGLYLQRTHKLTNKGVHATLTQEEVVKAVLHTYLLASELIAFIPTGAPSAGLLPNIHTATLDEIESLLGVKRGIAKEIIKLRVRHQALTLDLLGSIPGVGARTLSKAETVFSFEPVSPN